VSKSKLQAKYKITVSSSKTQYWFIKTFMLVCLLSVWLWPQLMPWQWIVQLLLSLLLTYFALLKPYQALTQQQFVLTDCGEVDLLLGADSQSMAQFSVSPTSVTSDWFCYLVLIPRGVMATKDKQRFWVFRDGVDEHSFRRICRVVYRMRRGQ
jgi:hypothetical protein